jgi:preprotein translocase subunit SecD
MFRGVTLAVVVLLVAGLWLAEPRLAAGAETEPAVPAQITFSLDMADVPEEEREGISARTVKIFLERLLGLGLPDPSVFQQAISSIRVAVPPDADLDEVVATLTGRGLVEFRERDESTSGWKPIEERGADGNLKPLSSAYFIPTSTVSYDPTIRQPQVEFTLDDEGALLMEAATRRLLGKPMGIFYDDRLVIAPVVQSVLRAQGVIAGLSAAEAKRLAVQLNSGALPVDVTVQP